MSKNSTDDRSSSNSNKTLKMILIGLGGIVIIGLIGLGSMISSASKFTNENIEASNKFVTVANEANKNITSYGAKIDPSLSDSKAYAESADKLVSASNEFKSSIKNASGFAAKFANQSDKDDATKMQEIANKLNDIAKIFKLDADTAVSITALSEKLDATEDPVEIKKIITEMKTVVSKITAPELRATAMSADKLLAEIAKSANFTESTSEEELTKWADQIDLLSSEADKASAADNQALNKSYNSLIDQLNAVTKAK